MLGIFEETNKAHDVWMVQCFVNGDLLCHLLLLIGFRQQLFRYNLAGILLQRCEVLCFVTFAKATLFG